MWIIGCIAWTADKFAGEMRVYLKKIVYGAG